MLALGNWKTGNWILWTKQSNLIAINLSKSNICSSTFAGNLQFVFCFQPNTSGKEKRVFQIPESPNNGAKPGKSSVSRAYPRFPLMHQQSFWKSPEDKSSQGTWDVTEVLGVVGGFSCPLAERKLVLQEYQLLWRRKKSGIWKSWLHLSIRAQHLKELLVLPPSAVSTTPGAVFVVLASIPGTWHWDAPDSGLVTQEWFSARSLSRFNSYSALLFPLQGEFDVASGFSFVGRDHLHGPASLCSGEISSPFLGSWWSHPALFL